MRSIVAFATVLFLSCMASGQTLSINISTQPIWGPVGYDHVEYYYLPDFDAYYYVPNHQFIYKEGGKWRKASNLPSRYRDVDLYSAHKVVVNERTPYRQEQVYRDKYGAYKGRHDQQPIRDSRDAKYFAIKDHPEHGKWIEQNRQDQDNRGNDQGNRRNDQGNRGNDRNR